VYSEAEILTSKLDLLRNTNMVDFFIETFLQLNGDGATIPQGSETIIVAVSF